MSKLKLIIKREFLAKVRNKSFIIMTILSPLLMVGLTALIVFLNIKNSEEQRTITYVDESQLFSDIFIDTETTTYEDLTELGVEAAKVATQSSGYYGLLFIPEKDTITTVEKTIEFYSEDAAGISIITGLETKIAKRIRNIKLKNLEIDLQKIEQSDTNVTILTSKFSGEKSSKIGSILKMIAGGGFGYLIFMFIIIYGTSVMRSVIEEKTNRIIEVIISSVKPFQLMLGKIIGNAFAGILQFIIWIISASLLMVMLAMVFGADMSALSTSSPAMSPEMIEQMKQSTEGNLTLVLQEIKNLPLAAMFFSFIFYFLGGYLTYSSIYAAIGAAVDSETDTQQFMMPVMLPLMIAIYVGFSVIENPHGSIAVGFSIFPLTSPIVMLMRIPFGVPPLQIAISMLLLILTFFAIVFFAAKIYRIGILMYGKKPTYKDLYKWLRY